MVVIHWSLLSNCGHTSEVGLCIIIRSGAKCAVQWLVVHHEVEFSMGLGTPCHVICCVESRLMLLKAKMDVFWHGVLEGYFVMILFNSVRFGGIAGSADYSIPLQMQSGRLL